MAEPGRAHRSGEDVLSAAPIACHELDLEGRIVWVNSAECNLIGRTAEELIGRPVWELVSAGEEPVSREAVAREGGGEVEFHRVARALRAHTHALRRLEHCGRDSRYLSPQ